MAQSFGLVLRGKYMKKILLIAMLAFTSLSYADDQRYTLVPESNPEGGGVWVLDNKTSKLMLCRTFLYNDEITCSLKPVKLKEVFESEDK